MCQDILPLHLFNSQGLFPSDAGRMRPEASCPRYKNCHFIFSGSQHQTLWPHSPENPHRVSSLLVSLEPRWSESEPLGLQLSREACRVFVWPFPCKAKEWSSLLKAVVVRDGPRSVHLSRPSSPQCKGLAKLIGGVPPILPGS